MVSLVGAPSYAIFSRLREKYIWRDIYDVGFSDEDGNLIDFPFVNGFFYLYKDINLFLNPETKYNRKYELNINDVTSANGNEFINEFEDAFENIQLDDTNNTQDPFGTKPYIKYQDERC